VAPCGVADPRALAGPQQRYDLWVLGSWPAGGAPRGRLVYREARPPCYTASAMADAFAVPGDLREPAARAVAARVPVPPPDPIEGAFKG